MVTLRKAIDEGSALARTTKNTVRLLFNNALPHLPRAIVLPITLANEVYLTGARIYKTAKGKRYEIIDNGGLPFLWEY